MTAVFNPVDKCFFSALSDLSVLYDSILSGSVKLSSSLLLTDAEGVCSFVIHCLLSLSHTSHHACPIVPSTVATYVPSSCLSYADAGTAYPSTYRALNPLNRYINTAVVAKCTQNPLLFSKRKYSTKLSPSGVIPGLTSYTARLSSSLLIHADSESNTSLL